MPERRFTTARQSDISIRRDKSGDRYLVGYASVFHSETDPTGTQYNEYDYTERIMPSAFNRTLRERADVYSCFNHDVNALLGRVSAGTLQLSTDSRGLKYKVRLPQTSIGNDLRELVARGDVKGSSFAFTVAPDGQTFRYEGGRKIRELHDLNLIECGPVVAPAYAGTTTGLSDRSTYLPPAHFNKSQRVAFYRARAAAVARDIGDYVPSRPSWKPAPSPWTDDDVAVQVARARMVVARIRAKRNQ